MATTLLDHRGGILKTIHTDEHDPDRMVEVMTQDLSPIIEGVKELREATYDPEFRPVGVIPDFVVEKMMRDGSWNDPAAVKRWLNDPQNECFRITKGRV